MRDCVARGMARQGNGLGGAVWGMAQDMRRKEHALTKTERLKGSCFLNRIRSSQACSVSAAGLATDRVEIRFDFKFVS